MPETINTGNIAAVKFLNMRRRLVIYKEYVLRITCPIGPGVASKGGGTPNGFMRISARLRQIGNGYLTTQCNGNCFDMVVPIHVEDFLDMFERCFDGEASNGMGTCSCRWEAVGRC